MFRPWLRVARPDDWTGALARFGLWPVYFMALLPVAIGRLPPSWQVLGFGFEEVARVVIALVAIYLLGWLRMVVWALVPGSVVQYGRRLWFRHRGRRVRIAVGQINTINVELRPPPVGEVFVIELTDGAVYDLCPVHWDGAARIYSVLARRVKRSKLRQQRRLARAAKARGAALPSLEDAAPPEAGERGAGPEQAGLEQSGPE